MEWNRRAYSKGKDYILLLLEDVERTTLIKLSAFVLKYAAASQQTLTIQK